MKLLSKIYTYLIFLMLYAPVIVMIIFSFNSSNSLSEFTGFSLKYYQEAFHAPKVMDAFKNTLILAVVTATISGVLGTAAAVGISRLRGKYLRKSLLSVTNIPMMNPDIVTGVSMMLLFVFVGAFIGLQSALSFWTMLIAHVTFSLPYVILSILPKIKQMDKHLPEAAMDLGCTPLVSFFKVELPCILPGVISGMLMAFTLSLDDFVISYFVKGTGFETLPIYIYSAVRKGVRPSLYAANTIIVLAVLVLLILINFVGDKDKNQTQKKKGGAFKKILPIALALILIVPMVISLIPTNDEKSTLDYVETTTKFDYSKFAGTELSVYNWGYYISDGSEGTIDVNAEFEKLTGIKVLYDNYDSNESLYTKLSTGGADYDIIIPSDYMVGRLIDEGYLAKLDFENIPNYSYIDEKYKNTEYDPDNLYSVPYNVGMVGIIYNTTMVEGTPDSWSLMWDKGYSGKILNFNNPRDAFAIAQFYQGIDINSEATKDWDVAYKKLVEQKGLLQSYVMDEVFNKMESGEAAVAPYYAGDFLTMYGNNEDLAFYYPKEGTNQFIDAICVPKTSKNKEAAELYINFLMDPEIAKANAEYMYYASPNTAVVENEEYIEFLEELHPQAFEILYASGDDVKTDAFVNISADTKEYMESLWTTLGATMTEESNNYTVYIIFAIVVLLMILYYIFYAIKKRRREKEWSL